MSLSEIIARIFYPGIKKARNGWGKQRVFTVSSLRACHDDGEQSSEEELGSGDDLTDIDSDENELFAD